MKSLLIIALGVVTILAEDSELLNERTEGNLKFSADLYRELLKAKSGNFLVCPLSVEVALALVQTGAKGETAKQISTAVHLPKTRERTIQAFTLLAPTLQGNDKYTLNTANKIYIKDNFKISDQYKSTAVNIFGADIQNIDFEKKQQAASEMNKWAEEKTHNKIKDLIQEKSLNDDSRLVLINAMYFKGKWVTEFNARVTTQRPFFLDNKSYVDVDMMEITNYYNYYESPELNAKFLEMPYEGDDITMTIILPNDKEGLSALESNISEALVAPKYRKEHVNVRIPKYETQSTIKFNDILKSLGMVLPLQDGADFSGMLAEEEVDPLKISEIIQKTCIEVDEKGTTAAAASGVLMQTWRSAKIIQDKVFHADHPFIFYLKHRISGISFIGRYSKAPGEVKTGSGEGPTLL